MFLKQFGGRVTKELISQYAQSENWKKGRFRNLEITDMGGDPKRLPVIIYKMLTIKKGRVPKQALPVIPFDKEEFLSDSKLSKLIWYGHSVVLMRMENKTILIDPMLGPNTTPIAPIPSKRFSENTLDLIDQFPEIDLILLTHDHYDHLDYTSIEKLKKKTKKYYVSLGVKRHLVSWGVQADLITEFDWWDSYNLGDIKITFTPTRHFSGRGLTDRLKTLWGGWVFNTSSENIWFSGDGGLGKHFKEIGRRLGPFDFAFMECGQYNYDWHDIHLFPEEGVQAAIQASAKKVMPVHWAGFNLSYQHTWKQPAEEFVQAAIENKLDYLTPRIGQLFTVDQVIKDRWWDGFE